MITSEKITKFTPQIRHGFFNKEDGLAGQELDILRSLCAEKLAFSTCLLPRQIHSPDVYIVGEGNWKVPPEVDALVTKTPDILIGIKTADCGAILLVDPKKKVIAACHAGWKGALSGVIEQTIIAMKTCGAKPKYIRAAMGPMIAQASYEVSEDIYIRFLRQKKRHKKLFVPSDKEGHYFFDLAGYIAWVLKKQGVRSRNLDRLDADTYGDEDRFFSYRRATHQGKDGENGRLISVIGMQET
ncbi:MAG: peptidoglycan editing factor PgeF [Alphaproteobacteria bacterium]